jgi:hypothetical protein
VEGEVFEGEMIEEQRTVEKQGQSYDEEKKPEWDLNRCFAVGSKVRFEFICFRNVILLIALFGFVGRK